MMNHSFLRCAVCAVSLTIITGLASFTGGSDVTLISSLPEHASAESIPSASLSLLPVTHQIHTVQALQADPDFTAPYTEAFLQTIRSGTNRLCYTGAFEDAKQSLSEIISYYCTNLSPVPFYDCKDKTGTFLEIEEDHWSLVQASVAQADQDWQDYAAYLTVTARSFNLNASDQDLVDQINNYICDQYDYKITHSGMPAFVANRVGQCWHYAKLFEDLCQTVGIDAVIVEDEDHAWNEVTIKGITYTFDVTYNDTGGSRTAYSWKNPTRKSGTTSTALPETGTTGWVQVNKAWRYLDSNGKPIAGSWMESDGTWYYFRSNGDLLTTSWVVTDGNWYYLKADGSMAKDTWINGRYVNKNGIWNR